MRKLSALVAYIIQSLNFVAAENVESFHVFDTYKPSGQKVSVPSGSNAICLYDQEYRAAIKIERFPVKYDPKLVFGLVSCWLMANDPRKYRYKVDRGANNELIPLGYPEINTTLESDETIAVELIVPFREPVFGIQDDNGAFICRGIHYRLADDTNPAEQFEPHYIIGAYDSIEWRRGD